MKTILIVLLVFPALSNCQTRGYLPLDIGNEWYFDNSSSPQMRVVADTAIGGRSYKFISPSFFFSGDLFLRVDSNRVYRYLSYSSTEEVIYDFSRVAGDTIYSDSTTRYRVCTQNQLVQYAGKTLRQWDFAYGSSCIDCVSGETLVDSIGWRECWSAAYTFTLSKAILGGTTIITGVNTPVRSTPNSISGTTYPNPFNSSTILAYSVPRAGNLKIFLFNTLGQQVRVLFDGRSNPGKFSLVVDANELSSGVYYCRLILDDMTEITKLVLLK